MAPHAPPPAGGRPDGGRGHVRVLEAEADPAEVLRRGAGPRRDGRDYHGVGIPQRTRDGPGQTARRRTRVDGRGTAGGDRGGKDRRGGQGPRRGYDLQPGWGRTFEGGGVPGPV